VASRTPPYIQRLAGGKKFRYVGRECPGEVIAALPRNTI
jgi:hypothetical protein